jgi:hypothetical protein
MADVTDLYEKAAAFLLASQESLAFTPSGPPDRAYVSPGQPAIDCEQLVVWNESLNESQFLAGSGAESRAKAINRGGLAKATIRIQITRCVPLPKQSGGKLTWPAPADLAASALQIDEDGWALWLGISAAIRDGDLAEQCSGAERLGAEKMPLQGGFGGWLFGFRVPLEGGRLGT